MSTTVVDKPGTNPREVAEHVGVPYTTLRGWVQDGILDVPRYVNWSDAQIDRARLVKALIHVGCDGDELRNLMDSISDVDFESDRLVLRVLHAEADGAPGGVEVCTAKEAVEALAAGRVFAVVPLRQRR